MNNLNKKKLEKLFIEARLEKLKNVKVDPDNVILNAAAFQDQLLIDMGLKKRKKKINRTIVKEETINLLNLKKNDKNEILNRRKQFLENLTFAEKVGIKELQKKVPLSLNEWNDIENKTNEREDYKSSCPICLENLSKRPTFLLSCSHIFHKVNFINSELYFKL